MSDKNEVLNAEFVEQAPQHAIVRQEPYRGLQPVMNLQEAKARLAEFQAFVKDYLIEDEDFGKIPGTPKPTLYKSGADKLCELYGFSDHYEIIGCVEDYDRDVPLFDYTVRCTLRSVRHQVVIASGMGSCNSYESRYKYRAGGRTCPECGKETIIKGKEQYGGGWLCFARKGGCGKKWTDDEEQGQEFEKANVGKVLNEDIPSQKNTILKMAKKRAKVDATLAATRSSGIFTQDIEEMNGDHSDEHAGSRQAAQAVAAKKVAAAHGVPKASIPPLQPPADMPPDAVFVSEVKLENKGDKQFMKLTTHSGVVLSCWHRTMFEWLKFSGGKVCRFSVKSAKGYLNIEGILQIGRREFIDNMPAVGMNEDPKQLEF